MKYIIKFGEESLMDKDFYINKMEIKKDYIKGKLTLDGELEDGTCVTYKDIQVNIYKNGQLKGETEEFSIEGKIKEEDLKKLVF